MVPLGRAPQVSMNAPQVSRPAKLCTFCPPAPAHQVPNLSDCTSKSDRLHAPGLTHQVRPPGGLLTLEGQRRPASNLSDCTLKSDRLHAPCLAHQVQPSGGLLTLEGQRPHWENLSDCTLLESPAKARIGPWRGRKPSGKGQGPVSDGKALEARRGETGHQARCAARHSRFSRPRKFPGPAPQLSMKNGSRSPRP